MKIGIIGAPASGKTTFAARLYARLLEMGISGTRLVPEYAHEFLGQNSTITFRDQVNITSEQLWREFYHKSCGFDPLICDSAVFIAKYYSMLAAGPGPMIWPEFEQREEYHKLLDLTKHSYDLVVYVPLFHNTDKLNQFRIHDASQSHKVDAMIVDDLGNSALNVFEVSESLELRPNSIEHIAQYVSNQL